MPLFFVVVISAASRATLRNHVCRIIFSSTGEKMIRVDANWIVAFMANKHAFRDWAIMNFIAESMSISFPAVFTEGAISTARTSAEPLPALVRIALIHFLPETFSRRAHFLAARVVSKQVKVMTSLCHAACSVIFFSYADRLAATTHAHAARIGIVARRGFSFLMIPEIANWFSLDLTAPLFGLGGDTRSSSTATVTIAIRDFVRGLGRGMIVHSNVSLLDLLMPPDDSTRRGGNSIGCYSFILA